MASDACPTYAKVDAEVDVVGPGTLPGLREDVDEVGETAAPQHEGAAGERRVSRGLDGTYADHDALAAIGRVVAVDVHPRGADDELRRG